MALRPQLTLGLPLSVRARLVGETCGGRGVSGCFDDVAPGLLGNNLGVFVAAYQ